MKRNCVNVDTCADKARATLDVNMEVKSDDATESPGIGSDVDLSNVPVDRGWAWVVCAACFKISFIMGLYDHALAVMFVDIVEKFRVSVTTAAVVFTVHSVFFSIGSIVSSNVLAPKFGVRNVILVFAVINSLSTIIIAFGDDIIFFHILHSLKGFSIGSMWVPSLGLLGHYFNRRRSLATALTNAGIGVSMLAVPPFVRSLLDNFGFRGSLLLVSGVEMQGIVVSMLLRPVSSYAHSTKNPPVDTESSNHVGHDKYFPVSKDEPDLNSLGGTKYYDVPLVKNGNADFVQNSDRKRDLQTGDLYSKHELTKAGIALPESKHYEPNLYSENLYNEMDVKCVDSLHEKYNHQPEVEDSDTPTEQHKLLENDMSHALQPAKLNSEYLQHTSLLPNNQSHDLRYHEKVDTMTSSVVTNNSSAKPCCRTCLEVMANQFDVQLLGDWLIRLMLGSTALGALLTYIPAYIPTLAVREGVDKPLAAMLLTISGGVNLVCLLLQGLIVDTGRISAAKCIVLAQCVVGTLCHMTYVFTSFPTLVVFSAIFGMFGGGRMSLIPVVCMDFVGVEKLSKALGFNAMVATISLSIHHPFLGYLLEKSGSFAIPFHYVGLALYISAVLLLLEPVGRRLNARKKAETTSHR